MKDDVKNLYTEAGPKGNNVTFIMTDAEIKSETFLEAINSMLATGEIPGLIPKDEKDVVSLECKNIYIKDTGLKGADPTIPELWNFFINRVKDCLHMVLAFSPVGTKFRDRSQKFPSLFSQCSINWFLPWPEDALISVSSKKMQGFKMDAKKDVRTALEQHMGKVHDLVTEVCEVYYARMRRHVYVTPKSYLAFIDLYKDVYKVKYDGIDVEDQNISKGLEKLTKPQQVLKNSRLILRKKKSNLRRPQILLINFLRSLKSRTKRPRRRETRSLLSLRTVSTKRIRSCWRKNRQIEIWLLLCHISEEQKKLSIPSNQEILKNCPVWLKPQIPQDLLWTPSIFFSREVWTQSS